jgi:hypothetical protein
MSAKARACRVLRLWNRSSFYNVQIKQVAIMENPFAKMRTATVSTRVSDEEYQQLEAQAEARGVTLSVWVREVLLRQQNPEPGPRAESGNDETVLAELLALRTILLNVLFGIANGDKLTAEEMQKLIEKADASKGQKAREKLAGKAGGESQWFPAKNATPKPASTTSARDITPTASDGSSRQTGLR